MQVAGRGRQCPAAPAVPSHHSPRHAGSRLRAPPRRTPRVSVPAQLRWRGLPASPACRFLFASGRKTHFLWAMSCELVLGPKAVPFPVETVGTRGGIPTEVRTAGAEPVESVSRSSRVPSAWAAVAQMFVHSLGSCIQISAKANQRGERFHPPPAPNDITASKSVHLTHMLLLTAGGAPHPTNSVLAAEVDGGKVDPPVPTTFLC